MAAKQHVIAGPCSYESTGWACNGKGYLCIPGESASVYPCPSCNTIGFLETAFARLQGGSRGKGCPCCGGGSRQAVWSQAVAISRQLRPELTESWLREARIHVAAPAGFSTVAVN